MGDGVWWRGKELSYGLESKEEGSVSEGGAEVWGADGSAMLKVDDGMRILEEIEVEFREYWLFVER
jgi:hypothetical protein